MMKRLSSDAFHAILPDLKPVGSLSLLGVGHIEIYRRIADARILLTWLEHDPETNSFQFAVVEMMPAL